nr:phospholipid/cholesterol/gamma-HCH transport system ATP-binding protein [Candidatus Cloacimonadota bacterium]
MIVRFDKVCSQEGLSDLSLSMDLSKVTLLYDPSGDLASKILALLAGLDEICSGEVYFGEQNMHSFFKDDPHIKKLGYVFDEGVMLSNLSLRENLLLPLRWLQPELDEKEIDEQIASWLDTFELDLDIQQRPATYRPGQLKLLGFVRTLLISPQVLLLDNPFFLLNKNERIVLYRNLRRLKDSYPMLIASIDDEFGSSFSDIQIDLSRHQKNISEN